MSPKRTKVYQYYEGFRAFGGMLPWQYACKRIAVARTSLTTAIIVKSNLYCSIHLLKPYTYL